MEPDCAQCLYLPPAEGKRGVWLQPERTFADYMEGVSRAIVHNFFIKLSFI